MKKASLLLFLALAGVCMSQSACVFVQDTIFIPKENKTIKAEILHTPLKKSSVQFVKTDFGKYYLKVIVTENLYFDKTDQLEIQSGKKSFYAKDIRQHEQNKHAGYFVVELFKNYIVTLKDDGLTAIVFNKTQTNFSKQDCALVKQSAKCFYEAVTKK